MTGIFLWPVHQWWGDLWQPSALIELQSSFQILFRLCRPKLVADKMVWKVASTWGDLGDLFSEDWREIPDGNLNILKVLRKKNPEPKTWRMRWVFCKGRSSSNEFFVGQQTWLNVSGCLTCGLTLLSYRYGDSQSFSTSGGLRSATWKNIRRFPQDSKFRSPNSKQVRKIRSISTESYGNGPVKIRKIQWKVKVPRSEMLSGINLFGIVERHPLNTPRSMACW